MGSFKENVCQILNLKTVGLKGVSKNSELKEVADRRLFQITGLHIHDLNTIPCKSSMFSDANSEVSAEVSALWPLSLSLEFLELAISFLNDSILITEYFH